MVARGRLWRHDGGRSIVKRAIGMAVAMVASMVTLGAQAGLNAGEKAPDFTALASIGGKEFTFSLADALKQGPVVLYFYPAAFTPGCTAEAHEFAEATDKFKALGATVIGVSHDSIETLDKFSVSECRSKFPVAADADQKIMKSYDAVLTPRPDLANRTSFVSAPDSTILFSFTDLKYDKHVENTLAAVEKWRAEHKG
jgi:thioredoxin-dependent peroxiredoxin